MDDDRTISLKDRIIQREEKEIVDTVLSNKSIRRNLEYSKK